MSKGWIGSRNKCVIIEVKVFEEGSPTQKFKSDKKNYPNLIKLLYNKFGFDPKIYSKTDVVDLSDVI